MKKNFIYALLSATVLMGTAGLTACSSTDDIVNNPDFDPETNTVKTQFAVSLQRNIVNEGTRMSATNVQKDGTLAQFKGITGMRLLPFKNGSVSDANRNGNVITLEEIAPTSSGEAKEKVKVYGDVPIHTETNRFLFYGYAKTGAEGFEHGALEIPADFTTLNNITFTPKSINSTIDENGSQYQVCKNLLALLNSVANVKSGTVTWAPAGDGETRTTVAELQSYYNAFIELKAGSSQTVKEILQRIYNGLGPMASSASHEGNALAVAIRNAILDAGNNKVSGSVLTLGSKYVGYPENLNLPSGAARIEWDVTNRQFKDVAISSTGGSITNLTQYAYPANIQYFVESEIKTLGEKVLSESDSWNTNIDRYSSGGTSVTADTRSVALVKPIQYGVGRFDLSVKALDGNAIYYDKAGNVVDVTKGYTLKGVLVGGQKTVNYQFAQIGGTEYTIYDNQMPTANTISTGSATGDNHTLVLQTKDNDTDGIQFALELENKGNDFQGKDGIIPAGGTFYLVGKLIPANATNKESTDISSDIKGYVFKQDYITTATCTIGTGSPAGSGGLAEATNGIPDLTVPSMELGFSVNLEWTPGLKFNVDF